jgi:quercetin dioxygenase-like cupin family protein
MLSTGQKFVNPNSGETVEIIKTPTENEDIVVFKSTLKKNGGFKVNHIHPFASESFEVLSGTLSYKLNSNEGKIGKGESLLLPQGHTHAHWNDEDEDLILLQSIQPCGDASVLLATLFKLAADGKLSKTGQPPFLQVMVWIREIKNKTYLADIPIAIQNFLSVIMAPIGKLLGYSA